MIKLFFFFEESNAVTEDQNVICSNYINMGASYFKKDDFENAENFLKKALEMISPNSSPNASSTLISNLGAVLYKSKKEKLDIKQ